MFYEMMATGVDRVFLATSVRRALPRLSHKRSLRQLVIAETRVQRDIPDETLFCPSESEASVESRISSRALGLRELRITQTLAPVPLAAQWGYPHGVRDLSSIWRVRDVPRPLLVLVGGWNASPHVTPARMWPLAALDRAGVDVAIPCLPFGSHACGTAHSFPGGDPSSNLIAMASLTSGVAQIVAHARSQGHPSVTLFATSLGAHLGALLATLSAAAAVDHFVLEKPLGHLGDLIRWHARGDRTWCHHVADRLQRVYRFVDPLERTPTVAPERVTVFGATYDQVTPFETAQSVAAHFHVPLRPIKASHLFDPGRKQRLLQLAQGVPRSQREA